MQTPLFIDGQFVDGKLLNAAVAMLMNDFEAIGSDLHTPGLLSPSSVTVTAASPSPLSVTVNLPAPFAVLFGTGVIATANGVVSGAATTSYAVNLASLVPGSGTVTVYLVASFGEIGEQQIQVIGPPTGHPDFDPTFAPFQFYTEGLGTVVVSATTTAPDNETTFELCSLPLAAGQTTINQSSISTAWKYASAVLNPTGVTPGTYAGATVTVGADGRVTGVATGDLSGRLLNVQEFPESGDYIPTPGMNFCIAEMVPGGPGGGGASSTSSTTAAAGGPGFAGLQAVGKFTAAQIGASQPVTIGAGGNGGAAGNHAGGTGGTTSLGTLMSVTGNAGGAGGQATSSGNIVGSASGSSSTVTGGNLRSFASSGFGFFGFVLTGLLAQGGNGTGSPYGEGGFAVSVFGNDSINGNNAAATAYGAGGGGGASCGGGGAATGGNGTGGFCRIWEY